jgi:hypothetical protein
VTKNPPKRIVNPPSDKIPLRIQNPINYGDSNFTWRVHDKYIDIDEPKLGWSKISVEDFLKKNSSSFTEI